MMPSLGTLHSGLMQCTAGATGQGGLGGGRAVGGQGRPSPLLSSGCPWASPGASGLLGSEGPSRLTSRALCRHADTCEQPSCFY